MTGLSRDELLRAVRLYLLADLGLAPLEELPERVAAALDGGCSCVQLRAKEVTTLRQIDVARRLKQVCDEAAVPFIVNDRVDVGLAVRAAGVHVGHMGEEDMLPDDARRVLGPLAVLGVSVGSPEEAVLAGSRGASYVSAGPMFATSTKANAGPAAGEPLLRAVRAVTELPLIVIGGITSDSARALLAAGADGLCVGSAILKASDPKAAARSFRQAMGDS